MDTSSITGLIFGLLGGLALFIFGMRTMSEGLSAAVGDGMRTLLGKATRNRMAGLGLGTVIGGLIQSSASVVLFIAFINAGLMTLTQSIAPILGANIGTTLAVQLISFKLSDYCLPAIFIGLVLHLVARKQKLKYGGQAILGFGLLFLGMVFMGDSIKPHRELFEPWLAHLNGSTPTGLIIGTLAAALITGVIQSSGAVIGMGFAMISAGAITDFQGIFPIIIGANVGTCVTGLLGSIGTTVDARRAAIAHLLFNLISTTLAIATSPLFYHYIPLTSDDLIRQAANAGTIKMVLSAMLMLPLAPVIVKMTIGLTPTKRKQPESSFLDHGQLIQPERAIFACLRELQRTSRICAASLHLAAEEFIQHDPRRAKRIKVNEQSVNAIKTAMRKYLTDLTKHYLSKRQSILIGHIDRCMSDLERIGDHIANLADIAKRQRAVSTARFSPDAVENWLEIHKAVEQLLAKVIQSLDPELDNFQDIAKEIIDLRKQYSETAIKVRSAHFQRLENKEITPAAGLFFNDYLSNFWRISKHIKSIALAEQQPQFWLKREKLGRKMSLEAPGYALPDPIKPGDYLDRLQSDEYL
ncbi:Na/Pi cotransporter family protein [Pontiella agarivorans]|uniref:Na/Pi cotransporter family protein n=1 Tax=Pontiella agarivorans TaxID=3038953 RepID=A0ABU5MXW5_9BACT|nr:Na/Pi cotransporter family protein [Pontiella agarivorans]MDZ8119012.1 Na/Pi cotransporter family protein [Pontiella agarivorans]